MLRYLGKIKSIRYDVRETDHVTVDVSNLVWKEVSVSKFWMITNALEAIRRSRNEESR